MIASGAATGSERRRADIPRYVGGAVRFSTRIGSLMLAGKAGCRVDGGKNASRDVGTRSVAALESWLSVLTCVNFVRFFEFE